MKKDGLDAQMPPNPAPHIINRLIEIGLSQPAGMGSAPLSWQEISAWSHCTGVSLPPWEARLTRRLSVDFLAESRRAEDETCPPPWQAEVTRSGIAAELRMLDDVLG